MMSLCFTMKTPLFNTVGCGKGTPPGYHLHGWFRTLQTLKPGDPIMMASVQVGHVESIALDPKGGGTVVRMEIERSVVVKADSTATINSAALPGRTCVVLAGGSPGATAALESAILKTRENRSRGQLMRLYYSADPAGIFGLTSAQKPSSSSCVRPKASSLTRLKLRGLTRGR